LPLLGFHCNEPGIQRRRKPRRCDYKSAITPQAWRAPELPGPAGGGGVVPSSTFACTMTDLPTMPFAIPVPIDHALLNISVPVPSAPTSRLRNRRGDGPSRSEARASSSMDPNVPSQMSRRRRCSHRPLQMYTVHPSAGAHHGQLHVHCGARRRERHCPGDVAPTLWDELSGGDPHGSDISIVTTTSIRAAIDWTVCADQLVAACVPGHSPPGPHAGRLKTGLKHADPSASSTPTMTRRATLCDRISAESCAHSTVMMPCFAALSLPAPPACLLACEPLPRLLNVD
jgi:hypothetical protein